MTVRLSTTVTAPSPLHIDGYTYLHPVVEEELILPTGYLTLDELRNSTQYQGAVDDGFITLLDDDNNPITSVSNTGLATAPILHVSRTSTDGDFPISTVAAGVPFPNVVSEDSPEIIRRVSGSQTRYEVLATANVDLSLNLRVEGSGSNSIRAYLRLNGGVSAPNPATDTIIEESDFTTEPGNSISAVTPSFTFPLVAGDELELVGLTTSSTGSIKANSGLSFIVTVATKGDKGEKGEDGAPGSGSTINVYDNGSLVTGSPFEGLNFINASAIAQDGVSADITLSAGGGAPLLITANDWLFPVTSNWAVNDPAGLFLDENDNSVLVRYFADTGSIQGVGYRLRIPAGITSLDFYFNSRARVAPGAAATVDLFFYRKQFNDNGAIGSWSAAQNLTSLNFPTNDLFQQESVNKTLASLSLTADSEYLIEITRDGGSLVDDWILESLRIEYSA